MYFKVRFGAIEAMTMVTTTASNERHQRRFEHRGCWSLSTTSEATRQKPASGHAGIWK